MTLHLSSVDIEAILRTVLLSGDDMGTWPVRRRWARGVVRLILAQTAVIEPKLRRLVYTLLVEPEALLESDYERAEEVVRHKGAYEADPALIALAQAMGSRMPGSDRWLVARRAITSPLLPVLRDVVDAACSRDGDATFAGRCVRAVESLDAYRPARVRGCLWSDILATRQNDDVSMALIGRLAGATGHRTEKALHGLVSGEHGLLAAAVIVAVSPAAFEGSTYDGWTSLLLTLARKRLRREDAPAADFESLESSVRQWHEIARERSRKGMRGDPTGGGATDIPDLRQRRAGLAPLGAVEVDGEASPDRLLAEAREAVRASGGKPYRICVPRPDARKATSAGIKCGGEPLLLVVSSMSAIRSAWSALRAEFPWHKPVVDRLMGQLFVAAGGEVRIRSTLLVGPPGSGKSALVRRLAELLGLPRVLIDGTNDDGGADLGGSSARWSNPHPLAVTRAFERHRLASVAVLIDELDKAPVRPDRHIVSLFDALLAVLEPSTAGAIPDPSLGVEVDASGVSWLATANTVRGVPDPILDRMQVLRCAAPRPEHVGALSAAIARDILLGRGLPLEAVEPLDELEAKLVARTWKGGSIRQLHRIVEAMIDARASYGAPSIH